MKYWITLVLIVCATALSACGGFNLNVTRGSGHVITESRAVSGFHAVNLAGFGELTITQGDTEALTIETDDNLLPLIMTTVDNGVLTIGQDPKNGSFPVSPSKSIKYNLQVKNLDSVQLAGAGTISAPSLKGDVLTVTSSGAGSINLAQLSGKTLNVTLSGTGSIVLSGEVESQTAMLTGLGNLNGADLKSSNASVTVSGAGNATVWATDALNVNISGVGGTSYYGNPKVTQSVSGVGGIKSLGSK